MCCNTKFLSFLNMVTGIVCVSFQVTINWHNYNISIHSKLIRCLIGNPYVDCQPVHIYWSDVWESRSRYLGRVGYWIDWCNQLDFCFEKQERSHVVSYNYTVLYVSTRFVMDLYVFLFSFSNRFGSILAVVSFFASIVMIGVFSASIAELVTTNGHLWGIECSIHWRDCKSLNLCCSYLFIILYYVIRVVGNLPLFLKY